MIVTYAGVDLYRGVFLFGYLQQIISFEVVLKITIYYRYV